MDRSRDGPRVAVTVEAAVGRGLRKLGEVSAGRWPGPERDDHVGARVDSNHHELFAHKALNLDLGVSDALKRKIHRLWPPVGTYRMDLEGRLFSRCAHAVPDDRVQRRSASREGGRALTRPLGVDVAVQQRGAERAQAFARNFVVDEKSWEALARTVAVRAGGGVPRRGRRRRRGLHARRRVRGCWRARSRAAAGAVRIGLQRA